jgi:DNA polymerase
MRPRSYHGAVLKTRAAPASSYEALCATVRRCHACSSMNHVHILGATNGPLDAGVLFVAEAPGRLGAASTGVPMTSDVTGRRFHAFLAHAGIAADEVFITNSVLCNPLTPAGNNRRPKATEVAACSDFLAGQLRLVAAPVVVAMGGVALEALRRLSPHAAVLARDAGRPLDWRSPDGRERVLVALYHPSIQSTLTRPHEQQLRDWRRLGRLWRRLVA